MEASNTVVASHDYMDARRVLSQCWIFTPERGLRPMTLHGNGTSVAIDGRRLTRWCLLDDDVPRSIVAYVYSVEKPSPELRARVIALAHERFGPLESATIFS
jgi:hypothetical protein